MIDNIYWVFLSTGLLVGFGHCIGMCGPIVVSLSLSLRGNRTFLPHILYNSGRIITYTVGGGIMGITGSFAIVISMSIIQKGTMIFTGLLIMILGLAMTGRIPFGRIFTDYYNPKGILSKGFQKLSHSRSTYAYFPLGLLLGFLPCGPVYTALISAARKGMEAGTPLHGFAMGAGVMLCFGLGTIPALLLIARLTEFNWLKRRDVLYKVGAILMVLVGGYFVIKGVQY